MHFNGPQTKFIRDSLYKHPVFGLDKNKNSIEIHQTLSAITISKE